jgi:hypothetical protein
VFARVFGVACRRRSKAGLSWRAGLTHCSRRVDSPLAQQDCKTVKMAGHNRLPATRNAPAGRKLQEVIM